MKKRIKILAIMFISLFAVGLFSILQTNAQNTSTVRLFDSGLGFVTPYNINLKGFPTDWLIVDTQRTSDGGWLGTKAPYTTNINLPSSRNVNFSVTGIFHETDSFNTGSIGIFVDNALVKQVDYKGLNNQVNFSHSMNLGQGSHTISLKTKTNSPMFQAIISKPDLLIQY